ncbi:MMPL family transporter [bacterium]|nr:MMPL family transporter [bacterium]
MRLLVRILERLFNLAQRRSTLIIFLVLGFTVISLFSLVRLRVTNDLLDLLPRHDPNVRVFLDLVSHFGPEENVVVILRPNDQADLDDCLEFAQELENRLSSQPLIKEMTFRKDYFTNETLLFGLRNLFVLTPIDQQEYLLDRFQPESVSDQLRKFRSRIITGSMASDELALLKQDPLELATGLVEHLLPQSLQNSMDRTSSYFLDRDGTFLLFFIKPTFQPSDLNTNLEFNRFLSDVLAALMREMPQVKAEMTGIFAIMSESFTSLKSDMLLMSWLSLLGILIIYGVFYRRLIMLVIMAVSLGCGICWTLGLVSLSGQSLNAVTAIFPAFLLGLGADFAIHFLERYYSELQMQTSKSRALHQAFVQTGTGMIAACLTTSLAFLTLFLTDYQAFRQLAVLGSAGLFIVLIAVFLIVPILLNWSRTRVERLGSTVPVSGLVNAFFRLIERAPRAILLTMVIITLILLFPAMHLTMAPHYLDIVQSRDNRALQLQKQLEQSLGISLNHLFLMYEGPELEPLLQNNERFIQNQRSVGQEKTLVIESIVNWLPSQAEQSKRISALTQKSSLALTFPGAGEEIGGLIAKKAGELGLSTTFFQENYVPQLLHSFRCEPVTQESFPVSLTGHFIRPYLHKSGGTYRLVSKIFFPENILFSDADMSKRVRELQATDPAHTGKFYGISLIMSGLQTRIRDDISLCILITSCIILGFLLYYFRSPLDTCLAILPVTFGTIWMLGLFKIAGGELNAINLAGIPLIIGIGVDDGIHLVHRFRENRTETSIRSLKGCLRAIILTSLTSMIGFGVLLVSDIPGIVTLGGLAVIGLACCLGQSLLIVPALFQVLTMRRLSRPNTGQAGFSSSAGAFQNR